MQTQTWWVGSAAPAGERRLDLGPWHPTRAGAVRLDLDVDDDRVTRARVTIGLMHRGAEKLFEVRDYRQGLGLANRHDWQAPAVGETSLALAVEAALGIHVPARATWLRTLAVEHTRLHTLLAMLAWSLTTDDLDAVAACREASRRQLGAWTGSRLHPMLVRIGGVEYDVDAAWLAEEVALAEQTVALLDRLPQPDAPLAGLAPVDAATIDGWGLSGPTARAAGLARDLRRQRPSLAYPDLPALDIAETDGDVAARLRQLRHETRHAARLVAACAAWLADHPGETDVRLPKILRLPEGEYYEPLEAPFGEAGLRVVSRGEKTPWRVFLRTPSQPHALVLEQLLVGVRPDEVAAVVASLGWVIGDVDK